MKRVLIGYSACPLTRAAFQAAGCEAWTCDLLAARDGSIYHMQCDVWHALLKGGPWDLAVLHPMCTVMNNASAWALKDPDMKKYPHKGGYHQRLKPETLRGDERRLQQQIEFANFRALLDLPFPVAIENPAPSMINTAIRPPDQIVHPYHFGDNASKGTGLWLTKGVPKLVVKPPRDQAMGRLIEWPKHSGSTVLRYANQTDSGQNILTPGDDRWLERSKTYPGIAAAMGAQWGAWLQVRS